jgi:hypothetical protein
MNNENLIKQNNQMKTMKKSRTKTNNKSNNTKTIIQEITGKRALFTT